MGIVDASVKSVLKPYTAKGHRLLSKTMNIPVSGIKHELPFDTKSMDIVEIASEFGRGHITITSYKDEEGKLVKRIVDKIGSKGKVKTVYDYDGRFTTLRTEVAKTTVNDVLTQKVVSRSVYYPENGGKLDREHLTIYYTSNRATNEVQYFETRAPHGVHNYVKTSASRNSAGEYTHTAIEGNILPQAELDNFARTPYLFAKNYPKEDFLKAITQYAKEKQNVSEMNINVVNKKLDEVVAGHAKNFSPEVAVDLHKHTVKSGIVDTINHELRHKYQQYLVAKYMDEEFYKKVLALGGLKDTDSVFTTILKLLGLKKSVPSTPPIEPTVILTDNERHLAKIFKQNFENYKSGPTTRKSIAENPELYKAYREQAVEIDARRAGEMAKIEYNSLMSVFLERIGLSRRLNWDKHQLSVYDLLNLTKPDENAVKAKNFFNW